MFRRNFLKTTGAVALGLPAFSSAASDELAQNRVRRDALAAASGGAALADAQTQAAASSGVTPMPLGFDTYTLRAFHWKALELIDYAAGLKLDTIQISSLDDFESLDPAYLGRVKDRAAQHGMTLDGGIGCVCPISKSWSPKHGTPEQYVVKGMTVARAIGARAMRCFLGSRPDRLGPTPIEQHVEAVIRVFRAVRSQAQDLGVKIALENHNGDVGMREVKTIIEESGKDFVGSNLDTGNPMWMMEDPLEVLEVLGPYVATTHVRDSVVYPTPQGAAFQWLALGDGMIDFHRFRDRFMQLCPGAKWQLEIITGRPPQPLPYLDPDDWEIFPKMLASDFARFLELVRRGHPYSGFMMISDGLKHPPAEYTEALKEQQRYDLERSVAYAQKTLGVGVRWRA